MSLLLSDVVGLLNAAFTESLLDTITVHRELVWYEIWFSHVNSPTTADLDHVRSIFVTGVDPRGQ